MKKSMVAVSLGALLSIGIYSTPAGAVTIKNGVNCSKAGATTKVGSKIYRCAKNPYVKPTQNTWTLRGCLTARSMWKDAKSQYEDFQALALLAGEEGKKTMEDLQKSITELESTMKDVACKRGA
jgi:hypothetical protein